MFDELGNLKYFFIGVIFSLIAIPVCINIFGEESLLGIAIAVLPVLIGAMLSVYYVVGKWSASL